MDLAVARATWSGTDGTDIPAREDLSRAVDAAQAWLDAYAEPATPAATEQLLREVAAHRTELATRVEQVRQDAAPPPPQATPAPAPPAAQVPATRRPAAGTPARGDTPSPAAPGAGSADPAPTAAPTAPAAPSPGAPAAPDPPDTPDTPGEPTTPPPDPAAPPQEQGTD